MTETEITQVMAYLQACRDTVQTAREKRDIADRAVVQAYQAQMEAAKRLRALMGLAEPQRDPRDSYQGGH